MRITNDKAITALSQKGTWQLIILTQRFIKSVFKSRLFRAFISAHLVQKQLYLLDSLFKSLTTTLIYYLKSRESFQASNITQSFFLLATKN